MDTSIDGKPTSSIISSLLPNHVEQTSPTTHTSLLPSILSPASLGRQHLLSFAAVIILLLVFAFARKRSSSSRGSTILLTGPPDAGKTAILSALVLRQVLPSHTSLQTNVSLINIPSPEKQKHRVLRLVDVPGHPRVRDQFKEHLLDAKAVVFVVDASTVARNGAPVAEHLHHILHALTSLPPSYAPPPLVILAHKFDILSAASSTSNSALAVSRVRTILERELEKRRASQAGGVGVAQLGEEEDTDAGMGGLECTGSGTGGFRFTDWEGGEVKILGSSVKATRAIVKAEIASDGSEAAVRDLADFRAWLQSLS